MPLGAQQLKRQRTSTLLSLGGVTASLLVIFAQLGIERAVYESSVRLHRMVSGELIIVPYGFKSMQLHAEVPVAVTDIIATNPSVSSYSPFWFGVMSIQHAGMPTSRRLACRHAFLSSASCAMPSITSRIGAAACGPTAALASGTKMRAPPKPEKPRAREARKAAAMSRIRARVEWCARRSEIMCVCRAAGTSAFPLPPLWGKVGMGGAAARWWGSSRGQVSG